MRVFKRRPTKDSLLTLIEHADGTFSICFVAKRIRRPPQLSGDRRFRLFDIEQLFPFAIKTDRGVDIRPRFILKILGKAREKDVVKIGKIS